MLKIFSILCFSIFTLLITHVDAADDEFYVFDVGQGNAQLAIYNSARLGFLFDSGTSSKQKHPKFQTGDQSRLSPFLKKEVKETLKKAEDKLLAIGLNSDLSGPSKQKQKEKIESSSLDNVSLGDSEEIEGIGSHIASVIMGANLNHLIVFLSHSDRDHINLIAATEGTGRQSTKPFEVVFSKLSVLVLLGGDFLGKEDDSDVVNLFNFLREMKDKNPYLWVEMPFYWGWDNSDPTIPGYQGMLKAFFFFPPGVITLSLFT